ncbi:MAG: phosphoribosylpyrophosphate synthetase [Sediminicola sp.]|tara:strand:+ start:22020 stop:22325 length:306 start_codon:yes stop_codon:yes gene_type:complete
MERSYISLSEAITALQEEGYTEDFNLCDAGLEHKKRKVVHGAEDWNVVRYYRFEGASDPDDNMVLYVIETSDGEKGLLVDAYGAYSGNVPDDLIHKLKIKE